jgi:hypothetical protein
VVARATYWGQYPKGLDSPERTACERIQSPGTPHDDCGQPRMTGKVRRAMRIPSPPCEALVSLTTTLVHGLPILSEVNHQPESRMRENRTYGSEGGGTGQPVLPTPITPPPHLDARSPLSRGQASRA